MKTVFRIILLSVIASLAACATPATQENMGISALDRSVYEPGRPLSGKISVGAVTGGKNTNPLWTSEIGNAEFAAALRDSLETAGLLNTDADLDHVLDTQLVEVDQPLIGFTFTVSTKAHYTLKRAGTDEVVLMHTIDASGTATTGDAFLGVKRLRLATERAAQENIKKIIEILYNFGE